MICYLCGNEIEGGRSRDHVPPQQFFAPMLRKGHNLDRLATLSTHPECNRSYADDEEYFVWSLAPLAHESVAGSALLFDHTAKRRSGKKIGLSRKVLGEFRQRVGNLYLPAGYIAKRFERSRIENVIWKVVRGLYYTRKSQLLPLAANHFIEIVPPNQEPSSEWFDMWDAVRAQPSEGQYQGVFAYKYLEACESDDSGAVRLHLWGLLLWDRLMIFVSHYDPADVEDGEKGDQG